MGHGRAGAKRSGGEDELPIAVINSGLPCPVYISFISQDRKNVMNNFYLGSITGRLKK